MPYIIFRLKQEVEAYDKRKCVQRNVFLGVVDSPLAHRENCPS